jgi:thiamine biosynthesis lipoprotein
MSTTLAPARITHELELRAMGTDVHLIVTGASVDELSLLLDRAVERIEELEQRWSRFRPDSEISRLNAAAGRALPVSEDTLLLVRTAITAHRESGGAFDPLLLDAVVAAGYDRTFDELADPLADPAPDETEARPAAPANLLVGCEDIEVEGHCVRLPAGAGFDPGGIGKGLAADLVSLELIEGGAHGACVNLGGDVRVRGVGPDGGPWTIAVEHPACDQPLALLGLHDGAVATSTTLKRRWTIAGQERHHLIDPATGAPSTTDLELATTVAADGWQAEIMAKSVLLRGAEHPFDVVDGGGAEALAVTDTGDVLVSDGFGAFTGGQPIPSPIPRRPARPTVPATRPGSPTIPSTRKVSS